MSIKDDVEKLLEAFWDKRVIEVSEDPSSVDDLYALNRPEFRRHLQAS